MPSTATETRMPDIKLPSFDRPSFDMPDLPKIDRDDVGKAVMNVATAVGLAKPQRSRWPFVLGAVVTIAAVGFAAANANAIRERLTEARRWVGVRISELRAGTIEEPVAFPEADPMPMDPGPWSASPGADYPEGLGTPTPEAEAVNGRTTVASSR